MCFVSVFQHNRVGRFVIAADLPTMKQKLSWRQCCLTREILTPFKWSANVIAKTVKVKTKSLLGGDVLVSAGWMQVRCVPIGCLWQLANCEHLSKQLDFQSGRLWAQVRCWHNCRSLHVITWSASNGNSAARIAEHIHNDNQLCWLARQDPSMFEEEIVALATWIDLTTHSAVNTTHNREDWHWIDHLPLKCQHGKQQDGQWQCCMWRHGTVAFNFFKMMMQETAWGTFWKDALCRPSKLSSADPLTLGHAPQDRRQHVLCICWLAFHCKLLPIDGLPTLAISVRVLATQQQCKSQGHCLQGDCCHLHPQIPSQNQRNRKQWAATWSTC